MHRNRQRSHSCPGVRSTVDGIFQEWDIDFIKVPSILDTLSHDSALVYVNVIDDICQDDTGVEAVQLGQDPETELKTILEGLNTPPPGLDYECRNCHEVGDHKTVDCPKGKTNSLTSYQGSKQVFGYFKCTTRRCYKNWTSGKSFANESQVCPKCGKDVIPKKQISLEKAQRNGLLPK